MILHILWMLLKIIGIILLILLGILFLLLLIILFVPVRYDGSGEKSDPISAAANVTWLFSLLHVHVEYDNKKLSYYLKLFTKTVLTSEKNENTIEKKEDEKQKKAADESGKYERAEIAAENSSSSEIQKIREDTTEIYDSTSSIETVSEHAEAVSQNKDLKQDRASQSADDKKEQVNLKKEKEHISVIERIRAGISSVFLKIKDIKNSIQDGFKNTQESVQKLKKRIQRYQKFLTNARTQAAYQHVKKEVFYLLRHYLPRTCSGYLRIGFDDPATTGTILGYISAADAIMGWPIQIEADFEEKQLEGSLSFKGHIRGCHLVKALLVLAADKNIRITIKRIRKLTR